MNSNYFAFMADEELRETMFFSGLNYIRRKETLDGKKVYCYCCDEFVLTIVGNKIKINNESYSSVRIAKKRIQDFVQ